MCIAQEPEPGDRAQAPVTAFTCRLARTTLGSCIKSTPAEAGFTPELLESYMLVKHYRRCISRPKLGSSKHVQLIGEPKVLHAVGGE